MTTTVSAYRKLLINHQNGSVRLNLGLGLRELIDTRPKEKRAGMSSVEESGQRIKEFDKGLGFFMGAKR